MRRFLTAIAALLASVSLAYGQGGSSVITTLPLDAATGILAPANGGSGVANNDAATLTRSGNHALTITTTGITGITLPTSGTLAILGANTYVGAQTFPVGTPAAKPLMFGAAGGLYLSDYGSTANVALGSRSLLADVGTGSNVAIGAQTLEVATTGHTNTVVGAQAGAKITTGISNASFGYKAGGQITTGNYNTFIGNYSGKGGEVTPVALTGDSNTCVGEASCINVQGAAAENTAVGLNAGFGITTGFRNTAMGHVSQNAQAAGQYNTSYGALSYQYPTGGNYNTALGPMAMAGNVGTPLSTGQQNVAVGYQALVNAQGANSFLVAIGAQTLQLNTSGTAAVAVGYQALNANTTGTDNTALGYQAMKTGATGVQNTAVGSGALGYAALTGFNNAALGYRAGQSATGADRNVLIGASAGNLLSTGDNNTLLGSDVAPTLTTGSNNIVVGRYADVLASSTANFLNIGNLIFGTSLPTSTTPAGKVGIKTNAPNADFEINGVLGITSLTTWANNQACTAGQHVWDADYLYVCTATNTVKRAALSTF